MKIRRAISTGLARIVLGAGLLTAVNAYGDNGEMLFWACEGIAKQAGDSESANYYRHKKEHAELTTQLEEEREKIIEGVNDSKKEESENKSKNESRKDSEESRDAAISHPQNIPDFIAYNYCIDLNKDESLDKNEFFGIKDVYRKSEDVKFAGFFYNMRGKEQITTLIYSPKGKIISTDTNKTIRGDMVTRIDYPGWLRNRFKEHGNGTYVIAWYVNGKFRGSSKIEVIDDIKSEDSRIAADKSRSAKK